MLLYKLSRAPGLTLVGIGMAVGLFFVFSASAKAAVLRIDPIRGTYDVGGTVTAGIYLDTENETVNTLEVSLDYPQDKLQLVSPSSGNSIISIYTTPPRVNNEVGRLDIAGGITGGANVKSGLVAMLTFRVKSVGTATFSFLDNTKVLLHDGQGTNVLRDTVGATYTLRLPPPSGPLVTSETHPEQGKWYTAKNAVLEWEIDSAVSGYSYMISDSPSSIPDDVSEGLKNQAVYNAVPEGNQFFHIKALRDGVWGGVTHYQLSIDSTGPANFPVEISPGTRTIVRIPYIRFTTTDALSGVDHFEIKIVALKIKEKGVVFQEQPLFVEAASPYLPSELPFGSYNVIVRAYDAAGNYTDVTQRLDIVRGLYRFLGFSGIVLRSNVVISWWWVIIILGLLAGILLYVARHSRRWHHQAPVGNVVPLLPEQLKSQLNELQAYRERYGKLVALLLLVLMPFIAGTVSAQESAVSPAQTSEFVMETQVVNPPSITTYSKEIYDEEIFYVGGRTEYPDTPVIIHVQNTIDGQSFQFQTVSDKRADWFYRHSGFLSKGKYTMWVQAERGGAQSVPSSKVEMSVSAVALRFGGTAVDLETIYLVGFFGALGIIFGLLIYIVFHLHQGRKKRRLFLGEIKRAEESIRRGFAVLKRDLEAELSLIRRAGLSAELSAEEKVREEELKRDLEAIQGYVSKEIWDAEHYAGSN